MSAEAKARIAAAQRKRLKAQKKVRFRELEGALGWGPLGSRRFLRRTGSGQEKRPLEGWSWWHFLCFPFLRIRRLDNGAFDPSSQQKLLLSPHLSAH